MANILLIDDDAVLLDLISNTLRLAGHTVSALRGPLAAFEFFGAGKLPIDLVLTDIDLTPISGFELMKRLRKRGFKSPVLFMSGYRGLAEAVAESFGQRTVLEKPFTAPQLRSAVHKALQRSKAKSCCAT
jgi:DNA-binding NtrC family response regulator